MRERLGNLIREALGLVREAAVGPEEDLTPQVSPAELEGLSLEDATSELPDELKDAFADEALVRDCAAIAGWADVRECCDDVVRRFGRGKRSALAITGPSGSGRGALVDRVHESMEALGTRVDRFALETISSKKRSLFGLLYRELGLEGEGTMAGVKRQLLSGDRRVIIVERAHNLYIRKIGGFQVLRDALEVIGATVEKVCWVLDLDVFAWRYLDQLFQLGSYVDTVAEMPTLSSEDLRGMFDRQIEAQPSKFQFLPARGTDALNRERWQEVAYWRRLMKASRGNLHAAGIIFCQGLRWSQKKQTFFVLPPVQHPFEKVLATFSKSALLGLAMILEHETLSRGQLTDLLLISTGETQAILDSFERYNVVIRHSGSRYAVNPPWLGAISDHLCASNVL